MHIWFFLVLFLVSFCSVGQQGMLSKWDDAAIKDWPDGFRRVEIKSSVDSSIQNAYFFAVDSFEKRPLIVSLHTWSGNYEQYDPLAAQMLERNYNYIHPDFRGANNHPDACCSDLVIADIEDAIQYAITQGNVDENEVHLVGVSGGGYATLMAYMKLKYPVKSFSSWVPISSIENWYWESVGRQQRYLNDILKVTGSENGCLNVDVARNRSPLHQPFLPHLRKNAKLFIYAGVHDGYDGSVPITHSIDMFNKIAREAFGATNDELVSNCDRIELVVKRCFPLYNFGMYIGSRMVHYFRKKEAVSLIIFEGNHEQLADQAISLIPIDDDIMKVRRVLNLGDSNSSFTYSWPQIIRQLNCSLEVENYAIPGNTVGFNNLNNSSLNTLSNIDSLLASLRLTKGVVDCVIVSLGTNDCKSVFDQREHEVCQNFEQLLAKLQSSEVARNAVILVLSVPPVDVSKISEKYKGIEPRIECLNAFLKKKASFHKNVFFLDCYMELKQGIAGFTEDGIHLNEAAQLIVAQKILNQLR